jgi:hypothetical protein
MAGFKSIALCRAHMAGFNQCQFDISNTNTSCALEHNRDDADHELCHTLLNGLKAARFLEHNRDGADHELCHTLLNELKARPRQNRVGMTLTMNSVTHC